MPSLLQATVAPGGKIRIVIYVHEYRQFYVQLAYMIMCAGCSFGWSALFAMMMPFLCLETHSSHGLSIGSLTNLNKSAVHEVALRSTELLTFQDRRLPLRATQVLAEYNPGR